jgi:endonuclease/exonuclease/phosphatase family metal-dependent hydrolase
MRRRRTTRLEWVLCLCVVAACGEAAKQSTPPDDAGVTVTDASAGATDGTTGGNHADATTDAGVDATFEAGTDAGTDSGARLALRVMSANTTSGTQQSYEGPGIRIFQGLTPDIVLVQEMKSATGLRNFVDTAFGKDFSYYVETRVGGIPNGIVSRYPIVQSGTWVDTYVADRAFAWARIDVPGPTDLWAISLHLLTTGIAQRDAEAQLLITNIQANIPTGDYLVVGGDLNTDTTDELALMDLSSVVVVSAPFPVDQAGNINTSTNRNRPHDWVLASPGLDMRAVPVAIGASSFPAGLVFDSRLYAPLSEVAPVLFTDSSAAGMQHMPVVRDFLLQNPDGGADAATDAADAL